MRIAFSVGGGFGGLGYLGGCFAVAVYRLAMFQVSVVGTRRLKPGLAAVSTLDRFTNTVEGAQVEFEGILSSHCFEAELADELQQ